MKINGQIHLHARREYDGKYSYHVMAAKGMSEYGYIYILSQGCEFEIPDDFNPVPAEIEMLRKAKQKIQADAQVKINAIDEQIQNLLCIEYKPAAE